MIEVSRNCRNNYVGSGPIVQSIVGVGVTPPNMACRRLRYARFARFAERLKPTVSRTETCSEVEIHDMHSRGFLAFDLKEILRCLGKDATDRVWRCMNLEVTGEATPEFEAAGETGALVTGERLLSLAERTNQVIWGDFFGRRPGERGETLHMRAVDSRFWEVFGDEGCLEKVRASFTDVRPAAVDAG